ncbi:hypothetical protein CGZ93_15595 [Enemella dayhoffiae]|uniref:Uncharacterized protein n=1 Tax=Enemella dayhoffiae TaxID=2016507 RepID=A0A255GRG8_9ACTN|nr:type IV toxin-antitoxin system AbiEi family antitoxin domain-containing protein [Enemella dayhoffiae]OYO18405.1 hypothetical protein CGZ93_15595 [Enemella dayhoffiae]
MDVHQLLAANHGVLSAAQLRRVGVDHRETQDLVRRGVLSRVRRGWYRGGSYVSDPVLRAVRAGGALTCLPALKLAGLWTPTHHQVHVRRPEALTGPLPKGVVDCRPSGRRPPVHRAVDPIGMSLLCAGRCRSTHEFVVLLDSALDKKKLTRTELEHLLADEPRAIRRALQHVDRAESGTETLVRLRLRSRGIKLRPQAVIPGIGRVDLLVGERLVIEVDSYEHHSQGAGYEEDRPRDQQLLALGYLVIRVSYLQVLFRWAEAEASILTILRRGDHYWPRRRRRS